MECAPKVRFATDSRWRKQNSNHRSPSRGCRLILGEEKGPAVDQIVSKDAVLFTGDQWFESGSLQWRVSCEPDFRGRIPSMIVAPMPLRHQAMKLLNLGLWRSMRMRMRLANPFQSRSMRVGPCHG